MLDFEVPLNPGWCYAFERLHGNEAEAIEGISPHFIASHEHLQMDNKNVVSVTNIPQVPTVEHDLTLEVVYVGAPAIRRYFVPEFGIIGSGFIGHIWPAPTVLYHSLDCNGLVTSTVNRAELHDSAILNPTDDTQVRISGYNWLELKP